MLSVENLLQVGNLELLAKQVIEGFITGLHKSPFHGFSVEFAEHRLYNKGESTRHIDWKLYARSEKLFTKRYEEETNLRAYMMIDSSSSMYFPKEGLSKIRFAVYAAASLIHLLNRQRDAAGICLFDEKIRYLSEARSTRVHQRLIFSEMEKMLQEQPEQRKSNIVEAIHHLSESIHKRSLVVIFSDMFDNMGRQEELFSALQHLRFNKHEVILFHIADRQLEARFDFSNRPHIFIDMETGERMKLQPQALKETYLQAWNEFKQDLNFRCMQYNIDFFEAEVSSDFAQVLMPFIIKRARLY